MRETKIQTPSLGIAAQEWGDPDAPPLVMLHGWLDNAASFDLLAPHLAKRFRVIALDLPGHGHSDHLPPGADYHYMGHVRAALAAVDALGLPRFHLLGHSLGAGIATLLAVAAPERVRRLLLIEGLGPLADDGSRTLDRFRDALAAPPKSTRNLRVFADVDSALAARVAVGGLASDLARPIVERGLREVPGGYSWRSDPRLSGLTPIRFAETQVMALLLGLAAPTSLLLARPHPPYLEPEALQIRIDCVDDIRTQTMEGGHHLHLEHPDAVAAWALDFA
ncbi:epoxide hydrolase [Luteibacter rhizovicinus]|uniref:Epoxide hydrolase n=1 Tax=Luteibacter rhizovicinus TaxID=242606 RepID=A0A4R3YUH6_9GAMM|nr:alpha/beta hydrolase [Luteibacter rhizovicinus]TCV96102.1 epoxide hydrolase [Luteibacter rhizovicinus]